MAIYDFKCSTCKHIDVDVMLPMNHLKGDIPSCCGKKMNYYITSPPGVIWRDPNIEAFRHVATKDSPLITTTKQNREYMARNNLVDANDHFAPPTEKEQKLAREEAQESIDAIAGTAQQKEQLREQGIDSIINEP